MWPFVANVDIELIGESKLAESIIKEREELIEAGYISNYYQSSPLVITSENGKKWYEKRWNKKLPIIDFSDNYLYISSDRKIKNIIAFLAYRNYDLDYIYGKITYYDDEGLVYWTMGAPIDETIIINRCRKENSYKSRQANGTLPKQGR